MEKFNLNKIIEDNLDKAKFQSKKQPNLPTDGWLSAYESGGTYISDKAKATQFGQYAEGGSSWMLTNPNKISTFFPRMNNGGGLLSRTVRCSSCGHSWKGVTGGIDPTTCHKCGGTIKMQNGGDISIPDLNSDKWLTKYQIAGQVIPGVTDFKMPMVYGESTNLGTPERNIQILTDLAKRKEFEKYVTNQPHIKQGREQTIDEKRETKQKKKQLVQNNPNIRLDENDDIVLVNPDRGFEGQPLTPNAKRWDKGMSHIMNAIEATGALTGAGQISSNLLRLGASQLEKQIGRNLVSKNLKNFTSKINPTLNAIDEAAAYVQMDPIGIMGNRLNSKIYNPTTALNTANNTVTGVKNNLTNSAIEGADLVLGDNNLRNINSAYVAPKKFYQLKMDTPDSYGPHGKPMLASFSEHDFISGFTKPSYYKSNYANPAVANTFAPGFKTIDPTTVGPQPGMFPTAYSKGSITTAGGIGGPTPTPTSGVYTPDQDWFDNSVKSDNFQGLTPSDLIQGRELGREISNGKGGFNKGVYDLERFPGYVIKFEEPEAISKSMHFPGYKDYDFVKATESIDHPNIAKVHHQFDMPAGSGREGQRALIMNKVTGTPIGQLSPMQIRKIPKESIEELYNNLKKLRNNKLGFDFIGDNLVYDPRKKQFGVYDVESNFMPQKGQIGVWDWNKDVLGGSNLDIYGVDQSGQNLKNALLRKLKGNYDMASSKFASDWYGSLPGQHYSMRRSVTSGSPAGSRPKFLSAIADQGKLKTADKVKDILSVMNHFRRGGMITDPMGQWAHPGQNTRIPGNNITMQGVPYPVLAKASNGMTRMMYPGQDYNFPGANHVDEYPMMGYGGDLPMAQYGCNGKSCTQTGEGLFKVGSRLNGNDAGYTGGGKEVKPIPEWNDISDIKNLGLDKKAAKALEKEYESIKGNYSGLTFPQYVAATRDADRTNRVFKYQTQIDEKTGKPDDRYSKYFDPTTGAVLPNVDPRNVDNFMRFYRSKFPTQSQISTQDILGVYGSMPGGFSNYENYANFGYNPKLKEGGNTGEWLEKYQMKGQVNIPGVTDFRMPRAVSESTSFGIPKNTIIDTPKTPALPVAQQVVTKNPEYIVKSGDTLSKIASAYNTTPMKLAKFNNIDNPNVIGVNQKIKIPVAKQIPQQYQDWEDVKRRNQQMNVLPDEQKIISYYGNRPDDTYLVVDKKNAKMNLYKGDQLLKSYEVGTGANPGDAQTVTRVVNGKTDWEGGNKSTGAGVYTISHVDPKSHEYFGLPAFNLKNDQGLEVATTIHGTPIARRGKFDNKNILDNRMSNGCINGKCYDLKDIYGKVDVGSKVYILPEDEGNQFQIVDGKPVLKVNNQNRVKYNQYVDQTGQQRKGQGVNQSVNTLQYKPIVGILNKKLFANDVYQMSDFNDSDEYKNTTKPYFNALVANKKKIMQATNIPSDVYNEIAKMSFGIYGTESNFGDTHSALGNLQRAIGKSIDPKGSSSPDYLSKYNTYGASGDNRSVGITQMRWNYLNNDEKAALTKLGITSNKDLLDPEKAAVATTAVLAIRYNQQLTDAQKKDIWTNLPTKWNTRANYASRVRKNSKYIKFQQLDEVRKKEGGEINPLKKYQMIGQVQPEPIHYNVAMAPLSDNTSVRMNTKFGPKDLVSTASTINGLYGAVNAGQRQEGKGEAIINTTGKFLDPTGISSWGDAGRAIGEAIDNPGFLNITSAGLNVLGALPFVHYLGATGKALTGVNKVAKQNNNLSKLQKVRKYAGKGLHYISGEPVMNVVDKATKASKLMPDANKFLTGVNKSNRFWEGWKGYTDAATNKKYGGQNNWLNNYK